MAFMILSTINVYATSCSEVINPKLIAMLKNNVFKPIKIVTPILLLLFTTLDFAKAVFNDNKDALNKAISNFGKRAVATLVVFFAPDIINLILEFINTRSMNACLNNLK